MRPQVSSAPHGITQLRAGHVGHPLHFGSPAHPASPMGLCGQLCSAAVMGQEKPGRGTAKLSGKNTSVLSARMGKKRESNGVQGAWVCDSLHGGACSRAALALLGWVHVADTVPGVLHEAQMLPNPLTCSKSCLPSLPSGSCQATVMLHTVTFAPFAVKDNY